MHVHVHVYMRMCIIASFHQACISITGDFNTLSPLDHTRHTREALLQVCGYVCRYYVVELSYSYSVL